MQNNLVLILSGILYWIAQALSINVALHAQVHPQRQSKVVGSVITTNGIKRAFFKRDARNVTIFYPGSYEGYFNRHDMWDFLIIEGWFPSIIEFLQVSRNHFPNLVIVFYCLDPAYPGLNEILLLDVDGIMTNSKQVKQLCDERGINSAYVLLGADADEMMPRAEVRRDWGAVYIGAAGQMLDHKPELEQMLLDAVPYRLRLHGSGWESHSQLSKAWQGVLPISDIAKAYSSAHVVLASTIESQDLAGMINNRIFEAMSCGSIVVTKNSTTLYDVFGDLLEYFHDSNDFKQTMDKILQNPAIYADRRQKSREFILNKHTWNHRVIEMENFLFDLQAKKKATTQLNNDLTRTNKPSLLWIVSNNLARHFDYVSFINSDFKNIISREFNVFSLSESSWIELLNKCVSNESSCDLLKYEVLLSICSPFDSLDWTFRHLPFPIVTSKGRLQRRAMYLLGVNSKGILDCQSIRSEEDCRSLSHYDAIFYRSTYEISLLRQHGLILDEMRLQHAFGAPTLSSVHVSSSKLLHRNSTDAKHSNDAPATVAVAFDSYMHQFIKQAKDIGTQKFDAIYGLGGELNDWLSSGVINAEILPRFKHVQAGRVRYDLFEAIAEADKFFVFTGAFTYSFNLLGVAASRYPSTTEHEVILPFVAAAVMRKDINIAEANEHILQLAKDDVSLWNNEEYLRDAITDGLDRLLGFPASRSKILSRALPILREENHLLLSHCREEDRETLRRTRLAGFLGRLNMPFALVTVEFSSFSMGRDGQFCLIQQKRESDRLICALRPMDFVLLMYNSSSVSRVSADIVFDIRLLLKGAMFQDEILHQNKSITAVRPPVDYSSDEISCSEVEKALAKEGIYSVLTYFLD